MTFYERMQALADRQIADKGSLVTIRAQSAPGDPVTGAGASDGATRTVNAVLTRVDNRTFPETIVETGDLMLLIDAEVEVGEFWVNGLNDWRIVAVQKVKPDNSTFLISKALVRG